MSYPFTRVHMKGVGFCRGIGTTIEIVSELNRCDEFVNEALLKFNVNSSKTKFQMLVKLRLDIFL